MEIAFYTAAVVAVVTTVRVIIHNNPVHALLYLIVSLLAVAVVFYTLGAPFAAALEVIVYAGAIVVLFVFVVMMLEVDRHTMAQERGWILPELWVGPGLLAGVLLGALVFALWQGEGIGSISGDPLSAKQVGIALFGPYLLVVELASLMLLAALVVAAHIGRGGAESQE